MEFLTNTIDLCYCTDDRITSELLGAAHVSATMLLYFCSLGAELTVPCYVAYDNCGV